MKYLAETIPLPKSAPQNPTLARRIFADLMWRAFPAQSENAVASKAAAALGCSPRQARNWLRAENDAGVRYVLAVLAIAGAEVTIKVVHKGPGA